MEPIDFDRFRAGLRGKPFKALIQHHIKRQNAQELASGIEGTRELLPPGIADYFDDYFDYWNIKLYDDRFWRVDCLVLFANMTNHAAEVLTQKCIPYDEETLFNIFQLAVLSFSYATSLQPNIDKHRTQLAQAFIEYYNAITGDSYSFECQRKSMFNLHEHGMADMEIYETSFSKKRGILAFLNRFILEVVKPNVNEPTLKRHGFVRIIDDIVNRMEYKATADVVCSKHLLIDCTEFGSQVETLVTAFDHWRHEKKELLERSEKLDKLKTNWPRALSRQEEMRLRGLSPSLWFENVFFAYRDNLGKVLVTK